MGVRIVALLVPLRLLGLPLLQRGLARRQSLLQLFSPPLPHPLRARVLYSHITTGYSLEYTAAAPPPLPPVPQDNEAPTIHTFTYDT